MQRSIFTRSLINSLDGSFNGMVTPEGNWSNWTRRLMADSRRDQDNNVVYFYRAQRQEFFTLTAAETAQIRRMADSLGQVHGSANLLALYLWLVVNDKLAEFINKLKGVLNADTQTA